MPDHSLPLISRRQQIAHVIQELSAIYGVLHRQAELERLIAWARRKHLTGPRQFYQFRLAEAERRLMHYQIHSRRLWRLMRFLYAIGQCLCLPPRYHARGSAANYRLG